MTEGERLAFREEFGDAFAGRAALVTGADGFLGSHLVDTLLELGAEVHAGVRGSSSGSLRNLSPGSERLILHRLDLTDYQAVAGLVRAVAATKRPAYVFHLAAQVHVGDSWQRPYETLAVSALGTLNLLDALVGVGLTVEKLEMAGTSEVYGPIDELRLDQYRFDTDGCLVLDEASPVNPGSIYATAKLTANYLALNYHDAYGLPSAITRTFHNYGPRQTPRTVTGRVISQALLSDRVELGPLEPRRDFSYCLDTVAGRLRVALHGRAGEVYCLGQGRSVSIGDWASLIVSAGSEAGFWPEREIVSVGGVARPGSQQDAIRADPGKLMAETGWRPRVEWADGLRRTIAWYVANPRQWIDRADTAVDRTAAIAAIERAARVLT